MKPEIDHVFDESKPIEEHIGTLVAKFDQHGLVPPESARVHPERFWEMVRRLTAKVEYVGGDPSAGECVVLLVGNHRINVLSDPNVPMNLVRMP